MPRVHSFKARTDLYENGKRIKDPKTKSGYRIDRSQPADKNDKIFCKKGQTYYTWKFRRGGEHRSTVRPTASQLTQSAYLSTLYAIQDRMAECRNNISDADGLTDFIAEVTSELEDLKSECENSLDNMPDHLRDTSSSGELLTERIEQLESAISELENIDTDFEEPDEDEIREELAEDVDDPDMDQDGNCVDEDDIEIDDVDEWKKKEVTQEAINEKVQEKLDEWLDEKCQEVSDVSLS